MYKKTLYLKLVLQILLLLALICIPFRTAFSFYGIGFFGSNGNFTEVDMEVNIPSDGIKEIEIDFISGDIDVSYHESDEIVLRYDNGDAACLYDVSGDTLEIRTELTNGGGFSIGFNQKREGNLILSLPQEFTTDLEIDTVSSDIVIGTSGKSLELSTVSGDCEVANNFTDMDFETVSGDVTIRADKHTTKRLTCDSVSGDLLLQGEGFNYRVNVDRIGGSYSENGSERDGAETMMDIELDSVSGDFELVE